MSEPTIKVSHVVKQFDLSASGGSLKTKLIDRLRGRPRKLFTALNDVTFDVRAGETLGLIGANGAGKSTLLSVIAGTMAPTSGHVETRGVVSSLLELGAGFHPDLTGRENVYLYGSIMGIPRETMRKRFDAIVDFSGLEAFIDQPVRFYSSGMYVRLGFAVAVQVDPDILLIDEVLAVGDADFQKKCLDKMAEFRKMGKSMLIISHDMQTIRSVSDRILFLNHGEVQGIGAPGEMTERYEKAVQGERERRARHEWGTGDALITGTAFVDAEGRPCEEPDGSERVLRVRIEYEAKRRIETPTFGFSIEDHAGATLFGSNTELAGVDIPFIEGKGALVMELDTRPLQGSTEKFMLSFSLHSRDHKVNYHRVEHGLFVKLDKLEEYDGVAKLESGWKVL